MQRNLQTEYQLNNPIKKPILINEKDEQGILFENWEIRSKKTTILNSNEIEDYSSKLKLPLPEMIFGNNQLLIKNDKLGLKLLFHPIEALKLVDNSSNSANLKVAYADDWVKERQDWEEIKEQGDPYDWTFTSNYKGTLSLEGNYCQFIENCNDRINMELLKIPEPILFYSDNILFEDELGDNGSAILNVKVRVMPTGFFILQRFSLRVDQVLFRIRDTRVYHHFSTKDLIIEYSEREDTFANVEKFMPDTHDKSHFNDTNLVYQILCKLHPEPLKLNINKVCW